MQAQDIVTRILARLDQPASGGYYTPAEALSAANEAQRFFALLTLGLETTASFTTGSTAPFFHMQSTFQDWLLPLRMTAGGSQVRPARLAELDSLDSGWQTSSGAKALRYAALGFDFLIIYPASQGLTVNVTYARSPVPMVAQTDVPEFPEQCHPAFVDYGVYRCREREGAQEFQKTLPYLERFLGEAKQYASYIRGRNIALRYDKLPFELERVDLSRLLTLRKGLVPERKTNG